LVARACVPAASAQSLLAPASFSETLYSSNPLEANRFIAAFTILPSHPQMEGHLPGTSISNP
jgi:hypothetical protein